jgi:hypothetical protein
MSRIHRGGAGPGGCYGASTTRGKGNKPGEKGMIARGPGAWQTDAPLSMQPFLCHCRASHPSLRAAAAAISRPPCRRRPLLRRCRAFLLSLRAHPPVIASDSEAISVAGWSLWGKRRKGAPESPLPGVSARAEYQTLLVLKMRTITTITRTAPRPMTTQTHVGVGAGPGKTISGNSGYSGGSTGSATVEKVPMLL